MAKKACIFLLFAMCYSVVFANTSWLDTFQFDRERPKIGVVLSGGGAKGIAHVGILRMLEELNIPIDYIGGTSMGAIVGGLYAIGYTADQIEEIVKQTDWMSLFIDVPDRDHTSTFDKKNNDRYLLRVPFNPRNITALPGGIIEGHRIDNMLMHYLFEGYQTPNFSDLQIPFFAVVSDLIDQRYVVLDSGNLAQAIRASMAVPSIFAPVEIGGRLMVDGGVFNNFPVLEMRRRGVDIIIGVDVGFQYTHDRDRELQNFAQTLGQIVFMGGQWLNNRNRMNTHILIVPDLEGHSAFSFANADEILQIGHKSAQEAYPELRQLADILSEMFDIEPFAREPYKPNEIIIIDTIIVHGNQRVTRNFVVQNLQILTETPVSVREIENAVHRLFGKRLFTRVTYHISILQGETPRRALHINISEAPTGEIRLGARYDNIRGSALLLGTTFRHLLFRNTELHIDGELSSFPTLELQYRVSPTLVRRDQRYFVTRPTFFFSYMVCNLRFYEYYGNLRSRQYGLTGHRFAFGAEISSGKNIFGLGFYADLTRARQHVGGIDEDIVLSSRYWYPQLYFIRNSFNERHFPTRGSVINARGRVLSSLDRNVSVDVNGTTEIMQMVRTFGTYYFDGKFAIPLSQRVTLLPSFMLGGTFVFRSEDVAQNHISRQQMFHQGGLLQIPYLNQTPFVGLLFMQKSGLYAANIQLNVQYNVFRGFFLTARVGAARSENVMLDMFDFANNTTLGAGLSASYNTRIGPFGLTLQGARVEEGRNPFGVFFNFGFWL